MVTLQMMESMSVSRVRMGNVAMRVVVVAVVVGSHVAQ